MLSRCSKLSAEDRKKSIVQAVGKVFAEKGFHGTTTRELAKAAGVSEALLFKHFPNKEALYSAMQVSCAGGMASETLERIKELEPSTSTLALLVHAMVWQFLGECSDPEGDAAIHHRLMMLSMTEDGEFARIFVRKTLDVWVTKVEDCLRQSVAMGEAVTEPLVPRVGAMFAKGLAAIVTLTLMSPTPIVDYGVSREELAEQLVWFTLRGMGVHDEAIKRCYNSESLAAIAK